MARTLGRHRGSSARRDEGSRGFALVVVIVVVLMASFLASQLIMQVRTEFAVSHNIKARVSGHFLAQAGLSLGLFRLLDKTLEAPEGLGTEEEWWEFDEGYEYEFFLPKGRVTYCVVREDGKIDLNRAPPDLIELFLRYELGEGQDEAVSAVVDSLLDWKDPDDDHHLNGAEKAFYEGLKEPYIPRNGPIMDPAEFFLINGTQPLIGKFSAQEVFTVNNPGGNINFNSLTPAMLDFLTGGDKEKAAAYREAKVEFKGKLTSDVAAEILGDRFVQFQPYLEYGTRVCEYYTIVGTGHAGVEQQDTAEQEDQGSAPKTPGTIDSMLIKKEAGGFMCMAWQERST